MASHTPTMQREFNRRLDMGEHLNRQFFGINVFNHAEQAAEAKTQRRSAFHAGPRC
jgi:hypothetical protein